MPSTAHLHNTSCFIILCPPMFCTIQFKDLTQDTFLFEFLLSMFLLSLLSMTLQLCNTLQTGGMDGMTEQDQLATLYLNTVARCAASRRDGNKTAADVER